MRFMYSFVIVDAVCLSDGVYIYILVGCIMLLLLYTCFAIVVAARATASVSFISVLCARLLCFVH